MANEADQTKKNLDPDSPEQDTTVSVTPESETDAKKAVPPRNEAVLESVEDEEDDNSDLGPATAPRPAAPLVEVLATWAGGTSTHGVSYALDNRYVAWKRLVWTLIVFVAVGITGWQVSVLIEEYRKYEVNVSFGSTFPQQIAFPDVVICNANSYSNSAWTSFYGNEEDNDDLLGGLLDGLLGGRGPTSYEEMEALSQPLEDFMIFTCLEENCYYGNDRLSLWEPVYSFFGRCWKFVGNLTVADNTVRFPGVFGGLKFGVYLNQSDYLADSVEAALYVFVNQKGAQIASGSPYSLVYPGQNAYLGLSVTNIARVDESPWAKCNYDAPNYTQAACRDSCFRRGLERQCNCTEAGYVGTSTYPLCGWYDLCYLEFNVTDDEFDNCGCDFPPCREEVYKVRLSSAPLSNVFVDDIVSTYEFLTPETVELNMIHTVVSFDELRIDNQSESKSLTFSQLLANLGGQFGLIMGISAITICEVVIELFGLRLLPRLWGDKRLLGIGGKE